MGADQRNAPRQSYRKQKILTVLTAIALLFASLSIAKLTAPEIRPVFAAQERPCLIIDPGHGGIDGGAIAYNGVKESDLNLQVALKLRDLAAFCGCSTFMTRADDSARTDIENYSEREDLEHRVQLIESVQNAVVISIHQNFFPTSQPSGAQVFYAPGEDSRRLGTMARDLLVDNLHPGDRRLASPAPEKLYLTSHVTHPAILVECGFLSNLNDLQLLCDDSYQTSIAVILCSAYLCATANTT